MRLVNDFRHEQVDPDRFYGALAVDSVGQLSQYVDLGGTVMLDVGGGPGYFRRAFEAAGATYFALDADVGEMSEAGQSASGVVVGDGMNLPFADATFDVAYSSNVLEHVPAPFRLAEEMLRVTRAGGTAFISYTVWYGPHGGHETGPWHYLGGMRARDRYRRRYGHEPKNRFGESLFPVTVKAGLDWTARQQVADVVDVLPRYHPRWARGLLQVPGLREVGTWNLALVLRKKP